MLCSMETQISVKIKREGKSTQSRFEKSKVNCGPSNGLSGVTMRDFEKKKPCQER